jgi:hypothetical protein
MAARQNAKTATAKKRSDIMLDDATIQKIKRLNAQGVEPRFIAERLGLHVNTINKALRGEK